jgi:hypothetical protein
MTDCRFLIVRARLSLESFSISGRRRFYVAGRFSFGCFRSLNPYRPYRGLLRPDGLKMRRPLVRRFFYLAAQNFREDVDYQVMGLQRPQKPRWEINPSVFGVKEAISDTYRTSRPFMYRRPASKRKSERV